MLLLAVDGQSECQLRGSPQTPEMAREGDLIIGGIFSFRTRQDYMIDTFQTIPDARSCLQYVTILV